MGLAINVSHTQEEADRQAGETVRIFKAEKAIDSFQVVSKEQQTNYWDARDNILNILQASEGSEAGNGRFSGVVCSAEPVGRSRGVSAGRASLRE